MTTPHTESVPAAPRVVEPWVELRIRVPASWKRWLQEAAERRGLSLSALVRQPIRDLMISRHDNGSGS